jgi:hypothetical protein
MAAATMVPLGRLGQPDTLPSLAPSLIAPHIGPEISSTSLSPRANGSLR